MICASVERPSDLDQRKRCPGARHNTEILTLGFASGQNDEQRLGVGEEAVADAADGGEVLGVGGVVLDVAAEADDEVVDGAGVGVGVDSPDLLEDVGAGDDLALAVGEEAEQVGLHDGEVGEAVGGDEFEGVEADGAVVEEVGVGGRNRSRSLRSAR